MAGPTRRELLIGLGGTAVGAGLASGTVLLATSDPAVAPAADVQTTVLATGAAQAGIVRPNTPQPHGLLWSLDLAGAALDWLPLLGEQIAALTASDGDELLPDGARLLTVTVGIGPRLIAAHDATLPGAEPLPQFAGDERLDASRCDGDVLLAAYGADPGVLSVALHHLAATVPGATLRWSQRCFRAPGEGTIVRNPLGFHDGVIVPRTPAELDAGVWIGDGVLAGGTVCVIRRLRLDTTAFTALAVAEREHVIGRHHSDGAPLSGGAATDPVDLRAKTASGDYLVPARSHARAAHPSFTGSELMLRRGYAFDDGEGDAGLLFICFQQSLQTFVATQRRLDEVDDLMSYATPTGSATFLILPGFTATKPLGAGLT